MPHITSAPGGIEVAADKAVARRRMQEFDGFRMWMMIRTMINNRS